MKPKPIPHDAVCEWCGQGATKVNPLFRYFREGKLFHVKCFGAHADEVLREDQ